MTSRDTSNTPSFPAISDYKDSERDTDKHNTLEAIDIGRRCVHKCFSLRRK